VRKGKKLVKPRLFKNRVLSAKKKKAMEGMVREKSAKKNMFRN